MASRVESNAPDPGDRDALLSKADELAAVAESMRGGERPDHKGADRAAGAAQALRDHVARTDLAVREAANYARANAPRALDETEE
jgi:hypothetical protein